MQYKSWQIFPATPADLDEITRIEQECFVVMSWSRDSLKRLLDDMVPATVSPTDDILTGTLCYVARQGDTIIGYISAALLPDEIEIYNIAILSAYRRNGVGRALLDKLVEIAAVLRKNRIILDVAVRNTPALTLYEKAGFTVCGHRKAYYMTENQRKEDALIMEKDSCYHI